ncbi:cardiac-enriched FHL2-interacting protein [Onychostruthus taczanowskii]|uniref:cardiac-enriched FHL2-interacting protein n=1 Tax=Onychostruthus taczanowskii TaxID=356909 RepID=UPI001B80861E|nr:cardiac-enriched FHL2-interacting protein [Onychostruthus taczanowskii]XP_041271612.1 cardiac-enriched FHL2-interacting protein [Onychostruthus taczanowskii]XP_041271613.1 cardiac-enriched FHL2-interacting protein [Onychostruthus taczanowskii]XP_041271614.1 cardiac-enriched FHL2-interacting protein [Onychostruthus taczanowskii]XP_041271615.1 cardiac-enriched FHL2-interacting protein [Onychostruthus taczanowskii]XP_041271616.1 cardiac-enriched FHL2-interacting protein [Onychostruthus taczano
MQGNKKHTEGHSDSSSIGSLLDDADREVSSLTARAFKSLCVAELEDPYNEPELSISPDFALQLSAKIHSGTLNHDIKKSNVCDKLTAKNNEHTLWASTFQQLPKCASEEKMFAKNNTFAMERKLSLPVPGPRSNKHVSKVSSLIKTFDKTADQGSGSSLITNKQPIKNNFQKYKINHGNDTASWDDTDILSIHKEPSEFSEASQGRHCLSGKHEPQRRPNKIDLSYGDSDGYYPVLIEMSKVAKSNFSHSSKKALKNRNLKVSEPAKKGSFLHSENSAFESWNVHHKKMTEKEEFIDIKMEKEGLAYREESPFVKGSHTGGHKLSPAMTTVAKKKEKDFQMKPTLQEASFSLRVVPQGPFPSETTFPVAFPPTPPPRNHVHQGPPRPPPAPPALPLPPPAWPSHPPTPPSPEAPPVPPPPVPARLSPTALSQASVSPQSVSYRTVSPSLRFETPSPPPPKPQDTLTEEESHSPQLGNTCPPWRRQRATERASGKRQAAKEKVTDSHRTSLSEKATSADPGLHVTPLAKQANSPGSVSPSFNITELLTPVIPPKQEVDTAEKELIPLTPPPTQSTASRDNEESTLEDYRSWDSCRLTASSLLFNLKDVRKRVKSIYTPSPLLRALEEKNKTRENMQESTKMDASFSISHDKSEKNITEKDELSDIAYVLSSSVHENDNKTGHFTGNYLSSPQTTEDLPFYQTGDSMKQDNSKHQDLVKNTGDNENFSSFRHESNELDLGKHQQCTAQRPFSRDNVDKTAGQPMQNHNVQGEENERQAAIQNENFAFKTLLNQLSPEEDEPYSGTQTNIVVPGHEARGKRSTSSSEQSFVSTVEQPLQEEPFLPVPLMEQTCLQESQRTDSETGSESKKRHKERGKEVGEDELQYCACISPGTDAAEKREGSVTGNEQRSLMKEKLGREKREEANSTNSASDSIRDISISRSEEPQTPSSSSSTKPSLFMIKDNTFRSPQVIRAVKLPLLRSFSLDDTVSSSYKEMERKFMSPAVYSKQHQNMLHSQEAGWWASRHRGQQNVRDGAADREKETSEPGSTSVTLDPSLLENTESFSFGKLTEEDEKICVLLNKFGKMDEESICRSKKIPIKARHSLAQPIIGLENDQAQNNPSYSSERKTNYFKNHHLSNRKGGSCAKKIITRQTISPVTGSILEDHTCSSVSNDTLEDILHTEGAPLLDNLSCSAVTSPRSGSTMHSLATSSLSEKPAVSGLRETEDVTNPALLNVALERQAYMPAEEIINSAQRNLLLDVTGEDGRLEPRGLGGRPAGKPPTVPPKTEKALRRAKKLANKRKKVQEQQKNHQTEHADAVGRKPTHSGETTVSASHLAYSPLHPPLHSTFTPTETTPGKSRLAPAASSSPSSTQRKLLQDPDSGQYYVVDLPAEVNVKTFYDPETGKYIQVSVPSLEQNLHQFTSSEMKNSPYASYPRVLPLPASSVAVLKSPSQLSEPAWSVPAAPEPPELPEDGQQDYRYTESMDTQPDTESASYSYHHDAGETQVHLGKDVSPTQNTSIVTLTNLDDFAAEGVS